MLLFLSWVVLGVVGGTKERRSGGADERRRRNGGSALHVEISRASLV